MATDAISRLIFRKPEVISLIIKMNNFEELHQFCLDLWNSKELEEDDISIIIVSPFLPTKMTEIIPPNDFSFPKEEEKEFISSITNQNYINDIDPIQMQQLNRMIQDLFREINFLKNKLKLTQVLLISVLLLLVLNTALLFYFIKNNGNNSNKENTISNANETSETEIVTKNKKHINNISSENKESINDVQKTLKTESTTRSDIQNEKKDQENKTEKTNKVIKSEGSIKINSKTDKVVEQKNTSKQSSKGEIKKDSINK